MRLDGLGDLSFNNELVRCPRTIDTFFDSDSENATATATETVSGKGETETRTIVIVIVSAIETASVIRGVNEIVMHTAKETRIENGTEIEIARDIVATRKTGTSGRQAVIQTHRVITGHPLDIGNTLERTTLLGKEDARLKTR